LLKFFFTKYDNLLVIFGLKKVGFYNKMLKNFSF